MATRNTGKAQQMTAHTKNLRSRPEAARRVREVHGVPCESSRLAKEAHFGTGPIYRIIGGRAYYDDADLDTWALSQIGRPVRKAADTYWPHKAGVAA